jgi:hexosaminidase
MRFTVIFLALVAGASQGARAAEPALMPMPVKVEAGSGKFLINANFTVDAGGPAARLAPAVTWFLARVSRQTGVPFAPQAPAPADARRLRIDCAGGPAFPMLGEDESYTLDVSDTGVRLKSATVEGAIHGLATFAQLIQPGPEGFQVPAMHIEDRPRFAWRGLLLDACRHWMPVEVVKRNLDAMAAVKLNVFHWHLSEDQGFRVESKKYPKLQQLGSDGHYYTQDQIRDIVTYARDRAIRVIPEFDMPGHTGAWFPGYPELAAAPGPFTIGKNYGIFDPVMDPTKESTYTFLDGFIGEMAQLFPDPYYHIGGDEVRATEWNASPTIQAFAKAHGLANAAAIQVYFNQRLLKIVQKYGKTMVGWDEILVPGLPTDAVIQSWRGAKSLADAASQGYRTILSAGYYLDALRPAATHYAVDPLGGDAAKLTTEQSARILGGEACMWSELVGPETVDSRIWPRMAAIAERFWSPKETTDVDSMVTRMAAVSRNLEWTGVLHRANYEPMLDRLAGGQRAPALQVLADAVEGRGLGTGRDSERITTATPLNRLVDAARPESELVRSMELAARRFLANPAGDKDDEALLRRQFETWAANDARFQPLAENNALLTEFKPLSKDLSSLGAAGLKMLDYLAAKQAAPVDWLSQRNTDLTRMSRQPGRGGAAGAAQPPPTDLVMAAFRPVKLLADGLAKK